MNEMKRNNFEARKTSENKQIRWNIKIHTNNFSDCFDCIIEALVEFYGYDSRFLLLGCFSTALIDDSYCSINTDFTENITRGISIYKVAEELFGMKMRDIPYNDTNLSSVIFEVVKKHPIIVEVDSFFCEWSEFYQKNHWIHDFIIVDIDEKDGICYCRDIYCFDEKLIIVPVNELEKMVDELFILCFENQAIIGKERIFSFLQSKYETSLQVIGGFPHKKRYLSVNGLKVESIGNPECLQTSIVLIKLLWMAEDKKRFSNGLRFINTYFDLQLDLSKITELLLVAEEEIMVLKNALIRFCITKKLKGDSIENMLLNIEKVNWNILIEFERILNQGNWL